MQRSSARRRIGNRAPLAAIELRQSSQSEQRSRSALILMIFMRLVALLCLSEGLVQWTSVLVSSPDGRSPLVLLSAKAISAVVFFALIEPIAAVGLWLGAPWGAVIWLGSTGVQLFVIVTMPGFFDHSALLGAGNVALLAIYGLLVLRIARAEKRRPEAG